MKRRELTLLLVALGLIAGSAGVLRYFKAHQRLGPPGLKTTPIADALRVKIELPVAVPGYTSRPQEVSRIVTDSLPSDTSIAQMIYRDGRGRDTLAVAVMMGTDRTSIHKPQYCLRGQGWNIDESRSERTTVRLTRPRAVDLPVIKLVASKEVEVDGKPVRYSCVFVYWLVAENEVVADHSQLMWKMSSHMLRTGELQRWSYVFYMATCAPGQEEMAFEQVGKVINATVPEFQLAWPGAKPLVSASR